MKYFVHFDSYGHARHIVTEQQLAEQFHNEPGAFLSAMCREESDATREHIAGHVGTLGFDNEEELKEYLSELDEEIESLSGCRSESSPYNF